MTEEQKQARNENNKQARNENNKVEFHIDALDLWLADKSLALIACRYLVSTNLKIDPRKLNKNDLNWIRQARSSSKKRRPFFVLREIK